MYIPLGIGLVVAVLFQTPAPVPIRIGTLANRLMETDLTALLALPGVRNPWLLYAGEGQLGHFVQIYLPPSTATKSVRRGTMVWSGRRTDGGVWGIRDALRNYAQIADGDRSMDLVSSDLDVSRPFDVQGAFTDDDLLGIVRFIRSKPIAQPSGRDAPEVVPGHLPIRSLSRRTESIVVVDLYLNDSQGYEVTLRRQGTVWLVASVVMWIA